MLWWLWIAARELAVTGSKFSKPRTGAALTAIALCGALLLGGCGRDTDTSEKLAATNAAAVRAEKAAERAEAALAKIEKAGQPVVIDAEPDATEDAQDAAIADQNEPPAADADVKG
ncbi:MAG: hypothetical protein ACKOPE_12935 [Novosphingobium sp.]